MPKAAVSIKRRVLSKNGKVALTGACFRYLHCLTGKHLIIITTASAHTDIHATQMTTRRTSSLALQLCSRSEFLMRNVLQYWIAHIKLYIYTVYFLKGLKWQRSDSLRVNYITSVISALHCLVLLTHKNVFRAK